MKTIDIRSEIFEAVIKKRGYSIRKLGRAEYGICNERTIRRALSNGHMKEDFFFEIAELLNVDPRYLAGDTQLITKYKKLPIYIDNINHHPFEQYEYDKIRNQEMNEWLERFLAVFNISYDQLIEKPIEKQYEFEYDLIDSASEVIRKHFSSDFDKDPEMSQMESLLINLEDRIERLKQLKYANTELRRLYYENPIPDYPRSRIERMTDEELLELDMNLQFEAQENDHVSDPLEEKYKEISIIEDP